MSWVTLSILSAIFLGIYDLLKKHAVRDNAVIPVLFFGVVAGASVWLPFTIWASISPDTIPTDFFRPDFVSVQEHGWLIIKSLLVSFSWIFGYFALKHLPLSTAGPIRSTGPLWTILIAVVFIGEKPTFWQWIGIIVILSAFYAFSHYGKKGGIDFRRNRWVWFMIGATILGACSSVYDKFLLQKVGLTPTTVQAWFSLYLAVIFAPFYLIWRRGVWGNPKSFQWRWSIPLIGIGLLIADILYFTAVSHPEALISVVSPIRRTSVLITFFSGVFILKEKGYFREKLACLTVMIIGMVLLNIKGA